MSERISDMCEFSFQEEQFMLRLLKKKTKANPVSVYLKKLPSVDPSHHNH